MNEQSRPTKQDPHDPADAILPGMGIVAGMLIGFVLWAFVEDWLILGPVGLWIAQGCLFAACVLIGSVVDGLIRPRDWWWRFRIRKTVFLAVAIMIVWALAMLTVAPAVVWANAGPPHRPGRLVGEPNGLESVAIKRERLSFDLRPLTSAGVALVEAVYEIENTGEEQTVDLIFVSGPMASDSAAVVLDEQPVPVVWKKIDALPPGWQAPDTTPSLSGKGTLPYEANAALEIPYFSISLSPGLHQLRVRYSAKAASYSIGGSPRLYWQMAYILAPGVEIPAK
jgi:hypothetical protein